MLRWVCISWALLALGSMGRVYGADEDDLVHGLPGQPHLPFKQYSGYVIVDPGPKQRALFYWFFEADHPTASALPVALWLQGGPGCSSIDNGALSEIGPLLWKNGRLARNEDSWNKVANLIFLDSPVGVGFSYTNDSTYAYNDYNTAADSYKFLVGWFKKFPEYSNNDLYLTGESYAGHYVPNLAAEIVLQNEKPDSFHIALKGFALGNPWTDSEIDNRGSLDWWLFHSLISDETYKLVSKNCDFGNSYAIGDVGNDLCKQTANQIWNIDLAMIVLENIYQDVCRTAPPALWTSSKLISTKRFFTKLNKAAAGDPCSGVGVGSFLDMPDVRSSLHAFAPGNILWNSCRDLGYNYSDTVASMLPTYKYLLQKDLKIWIYSGDVDANVPTTGTRNWISFGLDLPIVKKWYPWMHKNQVGGWTQVYKGLTFTSVRDAGHLVPADQPQRALAVFKSFVAGTHLPPFPPEPPHS